MSQEVINDSSGAQILSGLAGAQNLTDDIQYSNLMYTLRYYRDLSLRESDWILTYDNAMDLLNLDEWIAYRKALRDISSNLKLVYYEGTTNINWRDTLPTKPQILRKSNSS